MVEVTVTQEDIDAGVPCDAGKCPIARRLHSLFGGTWEVMNSHALLEMGPRIRLPDQAIDFADDFDAGLPVRPFTFTLDYDPPEEAQP